MKESSIRLSSFLFCASLLSGSFFVPQYLNAESTTTGQESAFAPLELDSRGVDSLEEAKLFFSQKEFELAIEEFQKARANATAAEPRLKSALDESERRLQSVLSTGEAGRIQSARSEKERVLELYNKNKEAPASASVSLGECQFQLQDYENAKNAFIYYLKNFPEHEKRWSAQFRLGECFSFLRDHLHAAQAFERFVEENPDNDYMPQALNALASARWELGEFDLAAKAFSELSTKYERDTLARKALFHLGLVYLQANRYDEAEQGFLNYAQKNPRGEFFAEALVRAGDSQYKKNAFEKALLHYNRVLAEGEGKFYSEAKVGIAWCYLKAKDFYKAAREFSDHARRVEDPALRATSFYQAVQAFYESGQYDEGLGVATEALEKLPVDESARYDVLYWKGIFHRKRGENDLAVEAFSEALKGKGRKSTDAEIHLDLAAALSATGKGEQAIAHFDQAAKVAKKDDAGYYQVHMDRAKAYHEAGKTDDAITLLESHFPPSSHESYFLARMLLAEFFFSTKRYEKALPIYQDLSQQKGAEKSKEDTLYRLAWTYKLLERNEQAIAAFDELVNAFPTGKYGRESMYRLAMLFQQQNNKEKANEIFSKLLDSRGAYTAESLLAVAEAAQLDARHEKALDYALRFLKSFPGNELTANALFLAGEGAYALGKMDEALKFYTRILLEEKLSPLRPNALYGRAWIFFEKERLADAIKDLEELTQNYPTSSLITSAVKLQTRAYSGLKKPAEAKKALASRLKSAQGEDRAELLLSLAAVERELGNNDAALATYDQVLNDRTTQGTASQSRALHEKGWLLMQMGKGTDAQQCFLFYLQSFPQGEFSVEVHFALGELAYDRGSYAEAISHYRDCLQSDNYKDKAFYKSAWCQLKSNNYPAAAELFGALAEKCPDSALKPEAVYRQGFCLLKAEAFSEAAARLESFVSNYAGHSQQDEALYSLAKVYEKLEKPDDAARSYDAYIKSFPRGGNRINAEYSLAQLLLDKGAYSEALAHYSTVLDMDKTHFLALNAQFGMGECYFKLQNHMDAKREFLKTFIYKDTSSLHSTALLRVARCHVALGEKDKALGKLKRVLEDYPNTEASGEALALLKELEKP